MNIGIITIGDEILIGQVINRNAAWIAERCTEVGATVTIQTVVGDEHHDLRSEITRVSALVDVIITTGGLGPTHDDITKDVIADLIGSPMVVDDAWLQHLKDFMKSRGRELTDRNAAQALVPRDATVLFNDLGTAPALQIQLGDTKPREATRSDSKQLEATRSHTTPHSATLRHTILFALPGVPLEMQSLLSAHVIPFITSAIDNATESRQYRTVHTAGIPESSLADLIGDLDFLGTSTLAFLPNYQGVRLRIGAIGVQKELRERELTRIEEIIRARAGRFVIGVGTTSLPLVVADQLTQNSHTLATAESCTGGLLGAALTDIPGSSAWYLGGVISYSNDAKVQLLDVVDTDISEHGAVSEKVALEMAEGARDRFASTWGIGITGVAGPTGGTPEKPVGTVWIGISGPNVNEAKLFQFGSDRRMNRERSVGAALTMLLDKLKK